MTMILPSKQKVASKTSKRLEPVKGTCDSCSSPASYQAVKTDLRLIFCGHHVRKNSATLLDRGFSIYPETYTLTP